MRGVGVLLLAMGMGLAQAQTAPVSSYPKQFEVASVRMLEKRAGDGITKVSDPGALLFTAHNASLPFLIQMAFGLRMDQIEGGPSWMNSTFYDVSAKPDADKGPTYDQLRPMLQQLLAQRFHLQTHTTEKEMKGYSLVVAKGGARLTPSKNAGPVRAYVMFTGLRAPGLDLKGFANMLTLALKQPVEDNTGIQGKFDLNLKFANDMNLQVVSNNANSAVAGEADSSLPSIFTAVQEQLGLKLEPARVPVQMLVIDHVERVPTEN